MAVTRFHKKKLVKRYEDILSGCTSLFIVKNYGLTVQDSKNIRRKLNNIKAKICIVKNSLIKIAIKNTPFRLIDKYLTGSIALVFSEDPIITAKALSSLVAMMPCKIVAALVEGGIVENVASLTNLSSGPEIRSRILFLLRSISSKIPILLNVSEQKLLRVLTTYAQHTTQTQEKQ